jgi:hypothetical protein
MTLPTRIYLYAARNNLAWLVKCLLWLGWINNENIFSTDEKHSALYYAFLNKNESLALYLTNHAPNLNWPELTQDIDKQEMIKHLTKLIQQSLNPYIKAMITTLISNNTQSTFIGDFKTTSDKANLKETVPVADNTAAPISYSDIENALKTPLNTNESDANDQNLSDLLNKMNFNYTIVKGNHCTFADTDFDEQILKCVTAMEYNFFQAAQGGDKQRLNTLINVAEMPIDLTRPTWDGRQNETAWDIAQRYSHNHLASLLSPNNQSNSCAQSQLKTSRLNPSVFQCSYENGTDNLAGGDEHQKSRTPGLTA